MNYDKNSFLAGISVGRTLKGWASATSGGGGSGGGSFDRTNPWAAYEHTRPSDWISLPEPAANEAYIVVHIPAGGRALLGLSVNGQDFSRVTYRIGTCIDGTFTEISSSTAAVSVHKEFAFASADYQDAPQTSDGNLQVVVKIEGKEISSVFWEYHNETYNPLLDVYSQDTDWNICTFIANLPNLSLPVGKVLNSAGDTITNVPYMQFFGLTCPKTSANGDIVHRFTPSSKLISSIHSIE